VLLKEVDFRFLRDEFEGRTSGSDPFVLVLKHRKDRGASIKRVELEGCYNTRPKDLEELQALVEDFHVNSDPMSGIDIWEDDDE